MSKVIKVSDGIYEQLSELSKGMEMPISELATKLIENSLKQATIKEETCIKKTLVFDK